MVTTRTARPPSALAEVERGLPSPPAPAAAIEDAVLVLLVAAVVLAFGTSLLACFALPKLLALRCGALLLTAALFCRARRGDLLSIPRPVLGAALALGAWWALTSAFAIHTSTALHGVHGRYNGLLTHETWLLVFLAVASMPLQRARVDRILRCLVGVAVVVSAYALLQVAGVDLVAWNSVEGRVASTVGQPVMLAAFLALALPPALVFLLRAESVRARVIWVATLTLLVTAILATGSRGPILGAVVASSIVLAPQLAHASRARRALLLLGASLALLAATAAVFPRPFRTMAQRLTSGREVGLRVMYARAALGMIRERPLLGAGFEHFPILYPAHRPPDDSRYGDDLVPTTVHNSYLQAAVTNGIPTLVLYAVLVGSVLAAVAASFRRQEDIDARLLLLALAASIVGFLLQDVTGWLGLAHTTVFWVFLGLAAAFSQADRPAPRAGQRTRAVVQLAATVCLIALAVLVRDVYTRLRVDSVFFSAQTPGSTTPATLTGALDLASGDSFYEDQAGLLALREVADTGEPRAYARAAELFGLAHQHNPFDVYVLVRRVELESLAIRRHLVAKPSPSALAAADRLEHMDPNNPTARAVVRTLKRLTTVLRVGPARESSSDHAPSPRHQGRPE